MPFDLFSYYFALVFFVLGLIIGSFLNVLILRHNTGLGLGGRSFCPNCGKGLSSWELIPVVSFVLLRGRCRGCHSSLSWQYPLVELSTGLLFLLVYLKYAGCWLSADSCFLALTQGLWFWAVFTAIFVYDLRHKIIPDSFIFPLIFLGVAYQLVFLFSSDVTSGVYNFIAPFIVAVPIFLLWLFSRGRWIGLGDAKLAVALGFLLGWPGIMVSIIYAVWIGAGASLILITISKLNERFNWSLKLGSKEITMKSEIAFGPFMIIGAFLVYFFGLGLPIFNIAFFL